MKYKLTKKRLFIVSLLFFIFIASFFITESFAQESKTGNFDIKKVQQAVIEDMGDSVNIETDNAGTVNNRRFGNNYMFIILRIIGYLVLLAVMIILVVWLLKRFGLTGTSRTGGGTMDLLESLPVGQNRSIILVRVMNSVLVLSQTAQSITLLEKIEGDKAVELIASTKGGTSIVQFKDVFNNFIGKIKKTP